MRDSITWVHFHFWELVYDVAELLPKFDKTCHLWSRMKTLTMIIFKKHFIPEIQVAQIFSCNNVQEMPLGIALGRHLQMNDLNNKPIALSRTLLSVWYLHPLLNSAATAAQQGHRAHHHLQNAIKCS
jgi:hypothetical protein